MNDSNSDLSLNPYDFNKTVQYLDALFASFGLKHKMGFDTVKYVGEVNGRSVTIRLPSTIKRDHIKKDGAGMPLLVVFEFQTAIKTQLTLLTSGEFAEGISSLLQNQYDNELVSELDNIYAGYNVWAMEPEWARWYLEETAVHTLLKSHLLDENNSPTGNGFNFSPELCRADISLPPLALTKEMVGSLLNRLVQLVAIAEQNPPLEEVSRSGIEKATKLDKPILLILGLIAIPLLGTMCCGLIFIIMTLMNAQ